MPRKKKKISKVKKAAKPRIKIVKKEAISKQTDVRKHIDLPTVLHVARLARLNLTDKEAKKYQKELNEILAAFGELRKVRANVKPSFHPMDVKDVLRKDEVEKCYPNEVALANTEHKEKRFFKGPRAV